MDIYIMLVLLVAVIAYPVEHWTYRQYKNWRKSRQLVKKYDQVLDGRWSLQPPEGEPQEEQKEDKNLYGLQDSLEDEPKDDAAYAIDYAAQFHLLDTGQVKALKVNPSASMHSIRLRSITKSLKA